MKILIITCLLGIIPFQQLCHGGQKPNILFIMSDDHTWQAMGIYGGLLERLNPTPNLDKLARQGMVFDNAVCTNSICSPSRASIMTGQYSHVNGAPFLFSPLPEKKQYLALEIKQAGYNTAIFGKWHLNVLPSAFNYYQVLKRQGDYFDPKFRVTGKDEMVQIKGHSTDVITDSALKWLNRNSKSNQPFFLMLHYKAPHGPFTHARRYESYLKDVVIPEPASLYNRGTGSIATRGYNDELVRLIGSSIGPRHRWHSDVGPAPFIPDNEMELKRNAYQEYLKKYLRCVKGVDDNVQRVIDHLKLTGKLDNTVIMYTGDQGMLLGEHDYRDKRWGYEPSIRMPLFVYYPKAIRPGRSDAIVENLDFPVTMLDYADVDEPDYMQGRSFRTILETGNEPDDWKQESYYHYWMHLIHHYVPSHIAMRTKSYKLMFFYGTYGDDDRAVEQAAIDTPPGWELYDLENDPHEFVNQYDNPDYADVVIQLKARFLRLRERVRADDPTVMEDEILRNQMERINQVIDQYWEYDQEDREEALRISRAAASKYKDFVSSKYK